MRATRWLVAALCAVPLAASADQAIPFITTDELKHLLDTKQDVFLADALSPIEFAEERIAGSVNVPYEALHAGKVKLPQDRKRRLVFYCKGPKCTKSIKTAGLAVKMGYADVAVYNEGLPEWLKRGYPAEVKKVYPAIEVPTMAPDELKRMLDARQEVVVLDIRDADMLEAGRIPGSTVIDLEVLDARFGELPKGKKIVVVDQHGKQTQVAGRFLAWKGFQDVVRLDGGFVGGWVKGGLPVTK